MTKRKDDCTEMQDRFDSWELNLEPLEQNAKKLMEKHFEGCENCQKWLSEWELVKLSTRELTQLEVPLSVMSGVMSSIESMTHVATATALSGSALVPVALPAVDTLIAASVASTTTAAGAQSAINELSILTMPPFIKSDLMIGIAALAALLISSIHYGREGVEGTAAWCLSFLILFGAQQLLKATDGGQRQKT